MEKIMSSEYFTINSILGQEKAKNMLRRAVQGERLSHAYLFRGPEGVGKRAECHGNRWGDDTHLLVPPLGDVP